MSPMFLVLLLAMGRATASAVPEKLERHPLILISCDGFRYDYLRWYPNETTFLRQLIPQGVHVKAMKPVFATKTFPNHWTIATGLYQESHGIISNSMYDPVFNATFNKGTREERWWNASLPIWISAKKQGLKSATFFWPGSEVEFEGIRQDYWHNYSNDIPYDERVKTVVEWIALRGVQMATMYLHEPDSSGHKYGPESKEVRQALALVDNTIRSLFKGLRERNFEDKVNILIVSDHGMMAMHERKVFYLSAQHEDLVERIFDSGPLLAINAKAGKKEQLLEMLKTEVNERSLPLQVFAREELPERFHYARNRRTPQVLVLAEQGYLIYTDSEKKKTVAMGHHGFDNAFSDMRVPMFAVGPSFKKNVLLDGTEEPSFRQVDIYGLICHVLKIKPQPNNGSREFLPLMLKSDASSQTNPGISIWLKYFLIWLISVLKDLA